MGEKRGPDRFTLTFYNRYDIQEDEVREVFGEIGRIVGFSYKNNRYFVRYGNKDEADEALNKFRDKYQCDYARERADKPGGGGGRSERNETRNESRNEYRNESRNEYRNEGRHDSRNEGRNESRNEGRYDSRNEGRNESRYNSRNEGHYDSRNEGRNEPRNESRYDSRNEGRYDSRNEGRFESHNDNRNGYDNATHNECRNEAERARRIESNDNVKPPLIGVASRTSEEGSDSRALALVKRIPDSKALVLARKIPDLIDSSTKTGDKFLFIIGNLPPKFTQDDVMNLISEMNPIHVGRIDKTENINIFYCPVHLDTVEKVQYLSDKLDGFVVGGHRLIAMESAQLVEEAGLAVP